MFPENKDICLVSILLQVLFCICYGVSVNINNLDDVHVGSDTRMTCTYTRDSSTSSSDPIVTWNKIIDGVADKISATQSGSTIIEPSYQDRFDVDRDDDRILVITNTSRIDNGTYQCEVIIFDDPPVDDDTVTINVIIINVILSVSNPQTGSTCLTCVRPNRPRGCQNGGGAIVDASDAIVCICPTCFSGSLCETLLNACSNNGCQNGAACVQVSGSCTEYICTCPSCISGTFCEIVMDACSSHVCQNGATCNHLSCTAYTCICPAYYIGTFCETYLGQTSDDSTSFVIVLVVIGTAIGIIFILLCYLIRKTKSNSQVPASIGENQDSIHEYDDIEIPVVYSNQIHQRET